MAEPIPSASTAATDAADDETQALPDNAEDRKAAAALNSLNANDISQDNTAAKQPSAADQEALGKAMSRLEIASGAGKKKKDDSEAAKKQEKKEEVVKKKVKIASEDVTFLVDELDLTKAKATELLRAHDGDVISAVKAFIAPPVKS